MEEYNSSDQNSQHDVSQTSQHQKEEKNLELKESCNSQVEQQSQEQEKSFENSLQQDQGNNYLKQNSRDQLQRQLAENQNPFRQEQRNQDTQDQSSEDLEKEKFTRQPNKQQEQEENINTSGLSNHLKNRENSAQVNKVLNIEQQAYLSNKPQQTKNNFVSTPKKSTKNNRFQKDIYSDLENVKSKKQQKENLSQQASKKENQKQNREKEAKSNIKNDARMVIQKYINSQKQVNQGDNNGRESLPQNSRSRFLRFLEQQKLLLIGQNKQDQLRPKSKLQQKIEEKLSFRYKQRREVSQDTRKLNLNNKQKIFDLIQNTSNICKTLGKTHNQRINLNCIKNFLGLTPLNFLLLARKKFGNEDLSRPKRSSLSCCPSDRIQSNLNYFNEDKQKEMNMMSPNLISPKAVTATKKFYSPEGIPLKNKFQLGFNKVVSQKPNMLHTYEGSKNLVDFKSIFQQKSPIAQTPQIQKQDLKSYKNQAWIKKDTRQQPHQDEDKYELQEEMQYLQKQNMRIKFEINEMQEKENSLEEKFFQKFISKTQGSGLQNHQQAYKYISQERFTRESTIPQQSSYTPRGEQLLPFHYQIGSQSANNILDLRDLTTVQRMGETTFGTQSHKQFQRDF